MMKKLLCAMLTLMLFALSCLPALAEAPAPSVGGWSVNTGDPADIPQEVLDAFSKAVGHAFSWCVLVLTASTCYEVFMRYVLNAPTVWAFDMSYMLYGALFIMSGAYALSRGSHVRGDFIYRKWRPRTQAGT